MLGSTLLSSLLSIWSQSRKAKEEQQKLLITRGEFEMKAIKAARDVKDKGFAWTRRIIALVSIFAIVLLPKLVAVLYPDVDVTVGVVIGISRRVGVVICISVCTRRSRRAGVGVSISVGVGISSS